MSELSDAQCSTSPEGRSSESRCTKLGKWATRPPVDQRLIAHLEKLGTVRREFEFHDLPTRYDFLLEVAGKLYLIEYDGKPFPNSPTYKRHMTCAISKVKFARMHNIPLFFINYKHRDQLAEQVKIAIDLGYDIYFNRPDMYTRIIEEIKQKLV